jgi:hypothetical protein
MSMSSVPYASAIRSIMYIIIYTHSSISHAVSMVCWRYNIPFCIIHYKMRKLYELLNGLFLILITIIFNHLFSNLGFLHKNASFIIALERQ